MTTPFENHIRSRVDDFLQTVVLVDDEAFRRAGSEVADSSDEGWDVGSGQTPHAPALRLADPAPTPPADYLDAQATTEAFGNRGLACAVLSPQTLEENEEVRNPLVKTARRADLVVFDWNLNGDVGKTTLRLIRAVLKDDSDGDERRLRVIALYTGDPDLADIVDQTRGIVTAVLPDYAVENDPKGLPQFTCGPVRVTVLAKEYLTSVDPLYLPQKVPIDELPARLRDEFCILCTGLVAGATVAALSGIRAEAHRLLTALGPELDSAYLGQRASQNFPVDAERQLESLLTSEIGAIVADREVGSHAGLTRIKQWLTAQDGLAGGGLNQEVSAAQRLDFLEVGLGDDRLDAQVAKTKLSKTKLRGIRKSATDMFVTSSEDAVHANRAFSERMVIRTRYSKPEPVLRLGVVVQRANEFAMCVQPLCDSVRLKGATPFPFLRLERRPLEDMSPGTFLLRDKNDDSAWIALKLDERPGNLMVITFPPNAREVVGSRKLAGASHFVASSRKRYRWVAELKVEQAQRAVENLARQFSRVGLAETEFLRLL